MGSAIAPTMGEIIMIFIEETVLNNRVLIPDLYFRFVDDIFLIWQYREQSLMDLVEEFNNVFESIKLTVEKEKNLSIAFLDIKISRTNNNDKIWTNVYYKDSAPLTITSAKTNVPMSVKRNSLLPFFKRAKTHTTFQFQENCENKLIENEARTQGYNSRNIKEIKSKLETPDKLQVNKNKFVGSIQYHKSFYPLVQLFKQFNVNVSFKSTKASQYIQNNQFAERFRSGVYEIPVSIINEDCQEKIYKYIGRTKRKIEKRVKEHINSLRSEYLHTSLTDFLTTNKQAVPLWKEVKILNSPKTEIELDIMENVKIWKEGENCINTKIDGNKAAIWRDLFSLQA